MIIDYISTIEEISIRDLLYNNWDTLVKEYIVGRDKFFIPKKEYYDYECCLKCHLVKQNFYSGMFGIYSFDNCIENLREDLFNILNEKQNKVILDILESNLKDDLDNYSTWDLPDCFGVEDLKYDGICEIVPESKSSPINRINNLRKNIGYVREEILAYPEYF
tara:strand:+ start:966 stop:1454 length:489 start_codon:yes stop_codon:yes gene_type:complete